jgi:uncharacterized protein YjbI with pentapeptide repeats
MQSESSQSSQPEMYTGSRSLLARVLVISSALALIGVVGVIIYGHTASRAEWVGVSDKDFWDYLKLLIVPTAIAFGVAVLNWMQSERARKARIVQEASERKAEADIREREREAQTAQRERELEVENQRAQDEALQAYLDQISRLLLDKQRPLQESREGEVVRTVARARTLTALNRLDGSRRRSVLQFLYESGLIIKDRAVVDLKGAALSEARLSAAELSTANLSEAALSGADLSAADLRGIDLSEAALNEADLSAANLHEANLYGADLLEADLSAANLHKADMTAADLLKAYLSAANLHKANLSGADLREAKLSRANLHEAILSSVDLRGADLSEANLHKANLSGAYLNGANLGRADLREVALRGATVEGALGIANEELQQQAFTLEGTTMPNGQKYEDWIKTYEDGHGEDVGNIGLS